MWGDPHFLLSMQNLDQQIRSLTAPLAAAVGAYLVDCVLRGKPGARVVEVYADTEAGISADALAELNRSLGTAIDEAALIEGGWTLIVSSPGLERPLTEPWQFRRHLGRTVDLELRDGNRKESGRIRACDDGALTVAIGKNEARIPLTDIAHALVRPSLRATGE
jgi:ribosome maturation factor RimP